MRHIVNLPLCVNGEDLDSLKVSGIFQQWRVPKAKTFLHSRSCLFGSPAICMYLTPTGYPDYGL